MACGSGHLPVCEWLYAAAGAAADVTNVANMIWTPMRRACVNDHSLVQQWLVLKGSLASAALSAAAPGNGRAEGALAIARRDIPDSDDRLALLEWAEGQLAANAAFRRTVLAGALSPHKSSHLWKLSCLDEATGAHFKGLVADFVGGVVRGRELRFVREAAEALTALKGEETDDGDDGDEDFDLDFEFDDGDFDEEA
jgi:hypothetical protein